MKKIQLSIKNHDSKLLIKNIVGSFVVKGFAIVVGLFTMPVYLSYFSDTQVLGIWFTLVSMLNWILNFDLGIGNGLRNKLIIPIIQKDNNEIRKYISSAYFMIGIISIIVILIGNYVIGLSDWNNILKIKNTTISNIILIKSIRILYVGVILQFFLKIITSILFALQKNILPSFLSLFSTITLLIYMILYKSSDMQSNLINLCFVNILAVNLPLFLATLYVFTSIMKDSVPKVKYYVKEYAFSIMKLGGLFFWIQISLMILNSTNQFLITRLYGPEYVVEYQIYFKLFYLFVTLFSLITNPVWSAVAKAWAENQVTWITNVFKKLIVFSIGGGVGCICLIFLLQPIIDIWLGANAIKVNYFYALVFMIEVFIMMFTNSITCIANGINKLKTQLICNTVAAIIKIPLVYLSKYILNDWICVDLVNICILLPCAIIQLIVIKKILNERLNKSLPVKRTIARPF